MIDNEGGSTNERKKEMIDRWNGGIIDSSCPLQIQSAPHVTAPWSEARVLVRRQPAHEKSDEEALARMYGVQKSYAIEFMCSFSREACRKSITNGQGFLPSSTPVRWKDR